MKYILLLILFPFAVFGQTEQSNMITYDTAISIFKPPYGPTNHWNVRITRPVNSDTAARPAIIMMEGEGENGVNDTSKLTVYGPHYWLKSGWSGAVNLGNGVHYPILITICYLDQVYTNVPDVYNVVDTLLKYYHIKSNSVHFVGLSEGAFTWGSLIAYEKTPGDNAGMKLCTSVVALEGTPNPSLTNPNNTLAADTPLYKIWAAKYHGKYFYLEGSGADNFRNGFQYSTAMNDSVPGSAYFSYENAGGGGHGAWNTMLDPTVTNWTSVGQLGTYNSPSQQGINSMGSYHAPSSVFQWMLRQGDTTLVGSNPIIVPPVVTPPIIPPVIVPPPTNGTVYPIIDSLVKTMDSITQRVVITPDNNPVVIDTLSIPVGKDGYFVIEAFTTGPSATDHGHCIYDYYYTNGSAGYQQIYPPYSHPVCLEFGVLAGKVSFALEIRNGKLVVVVTGVSKTNVTWTVNIHQSVSK